MGKRKASDEMEETDEVEPEEIEVEPPRRTKQQSANDRVKAAKLRIKLKAGVELRPSEAEWLANYEKQVLAARESMGARRSHEVTFSERSDEAVGIGESVVAMQAAAAMSRAEGERTDSLARIGIDALKEAANVSVKMMEVMTRRQESSEKALVSLMASWRAEFLRATHGEAEAIIRDAEAEAGEEKDGITKLAEQLLPMLAPALAEAMASKGGGK